jgi:hypothetical protein
MSNGKIETPEEFQLRCEKLGQGIRMLNVLEGNGSVWMAVICSVVVEVCSSSGDSEKSYNQFNDVLKLLMDEEKKKINQEKGS